MSNRPEGDHPAPLASVTGTPARFFERYRTRRRAWLAILSPPFLVFAVAWLWWASHTLVAPDVPDLTMVNIHFFPACLIGFGGLASLVGIWSLYALPRQPIYESPCPCCGARKVRDFSNPVQPPACGSCAAYLRANGPEIAEEKAEALDMYDPRYRVPRARYEALPQARRRSEYLDFAMPAMCAICGAPDPKHKRRIYRVGESRGGSSGGLLGAIASEALTSAESDLGMGGRASNYMSLKNLNNSAPSRREYNPRLEHLKVPVCTAHREEVYEPNHDAVADCYGDLGFASYRFYKAFCELHHVYDAPPAERAARAP